MPKFDPAVRRELEKQVCMRCNARNGVDAESCRKCGYKNLRRKSKERRNA